MPISDYGVKALKALRTGVGAVGSDVLGGISRVAPNTTNLVRDGVDKIKVDPNSETYKFLDKLPADAPELAAGTAALGVGGYLGYKALSGNRDKRAADEEAAIEVIANDILACETPAQALSKLAFYMEVTREDIMDKASEIVTEELVKQAYNVTDEDYNDAGYDSDETVQKKLNPLKWGGAAAGVLGGAYLGHKQGLKWGEQLANDVMQQANFEPGFLGFGQEEAAKFAKGLTGAGVGIAGAGLGGAAGGYAGQTIGALQYNAQRAMNDEPIDPYAGGIEIGNLAVPAGAVIAAKTKGPTRMLSAAGGLVAPPLARSIGSAVKDMTVEEGID